MAGLQNLQAGQVFAEKYRVVRLLKAGGMGAVYEVRHVSNDKRWALKLMHPELARDAAARERFAREAKIDGIIESAFVVSVIDAGVDAPNGMPYLVMEFLVGEELGERLERVGRFSEEEVVSYLGNVARALDKAHANKIVHRDLKPDNLFLCQGEDGERVKVLDFGIAKLLETVVQSSTHSAGTPLYMAPEQTRRGREIGPWTDIWSLGLIAYTLLVGRPYWHAETIGELFGEILDTAAREKPSVRAAGLLPMTFDAWFFRCVDNDPARRFATAGEAIRELGAALDTTRFSAPETARMAPLTPPPAPPPGRGMQTTAQPVAFTGAIAGPRVATRKTPVVLYVVIGIALLAMVSVAGVVGLYLLGGKQPAVVTATDAAPPPESTASSIAVDASAVPSAPSAEQASTEASAPPPMANASTPAIHGKPPKASPGGDPAVAPTSVASPVVIPIDRQAMQAAIGHVNVQSCKRPGGPTGAGRAKITFALDGTVSSVVLDEGQFSGTSTGTCIIAKYRDARIPAFTGDPRGIGIGKSFNVN